MDIFDLEKQVFRILKSYDVVVNIAMDSPDRFESSKLVGGLYVTDVTGMPQLIHVLEKIKDLRDDHPMRIRQQPYFFHLSPFNFHLILSIALTLSISFLRPVEATKVKIKARRGKKAPQAGQRNDGKAEMGTPVFIR